MLVRINMSNLLELSQIVAAAKSDGAQPITITGDTLLALLQLAGAVSAPVPVSAPEPAKAEAPADEWLTIKDICRDLGIHRYTLQMMRDNDKFIPERKIGRRVVFRRSEFLAWKFPA
jgi:predicted DNA-binding transcriptional regulator AlpA